MNNFEVIGLSGKAQSGKDYIYSHFLKPLGYHNWALATHFKIALAGRRTWSFEDVFINKPPACRSDLQQEGTERGRLIYGEDVWCETALAWMRLLNEQWDIKKFVVTDIRFPNEATFIRNNGGKVYRIVAPARSAKSTLTPIQREHVSETALDGYDQFDGYIYNDPKFAETVGVQMRKLLGEPLVVDEPNTWVDVLRDFLPW